MMFRLLLFMVTLHQAQSDCNMTGVCPDSPAVQKLIVDVHNHYRRNVKPEARNMLMMNYSAAVAQNAQSWVDQCVLAHGPASSRLLDGYHLGENLFYSGTVQNWTNVIAAWAGERSRYLYPNGSTDGRSIGHYTQVVWNSSYKVGCAMKQCRSDLFLYGCHYYRAGNFRRYPPYELGPRCGACPNDCVDFLCTNPCPYVNLFSNCPTLRDTTGCQNQLVWTWCPASCRCTTQIIPIA